MKSFNATRIIYVAFVIFTFFMYARLDDVEFVHLLTLVVVSFNAVIGHHIISVVENINRGNN